MDIIMRISFASIFTAYLGAIPLLCHAASEQEWGIAVGNLVSAGYVFELATAGKCSKYGKRPHDHHADVKEALAYIPEKLRLDAAAELSEMNMAKKRKALKLFFEDLQATMIPVGSQDFTCGMSIGMAATNYSNARQKWSVLTGAPPFAFSK